MKGAVVEKKWLKKTRLNKIASLENQNSNNQNCYNTDIAHKEFQRPGIEKPAHELNWMCSSFYMIADTMPSKTHWIPTVFTALRKISPSVQQSSVWQLLWAVPHFSCMSADSKAFDPDTGVYKVSNVCGPRPQRSYTRTHTHSHTSTIQSLQPPRHLPTVTPQHMLLVTRLVAQSRSCSGF